MLNRHQVGTAALVLILLAPVTVLATTQTSVTTGHVNYVDMEGLDPCLAAIAGLARLRVMWFDDSILHERDTINGGSYIYATEHGAPAPVDRLLVRSKTIVFEDPNGIEWNVTEAYFHWNVTQDQDADQSSDTSIGGTFSEETYVEYEAEIIRFYVWIVEIGPTTYDAHAGTDDHERYNFVNMVDTCKFNDWVGNQTVNHTGNDPGFGHNASDGNHTHETYMVDIYSGGEPDVLPLDAEPPHRVEGRKEGSGESEDNYE